MIDYDLSYDSNYAIIKDWMDIENFVDYQIFENNNQFRQGRVNRGYSLGHLII